MNQKPKIETFGPVEFMGVALLGNPELVSFQTWSGERGHPHWEARAAYLFRTWDSRLNASQLAPYSVGS